MPLDPETVRLIEKNVQTFTLVEERLKTHDQNSKASLEQLLISSNEMVSVLNKIHATLNNGLVEKVANVFKSQQRVEEEQKRKDAIKAGLKPRSRANDAPWMRILKYGGGGMVLGGIAFETWADALAKFFTALAEG